MEEESENGEIPGDHRKAFILSTEAIVNTCTFTRLKHFGIGGEKTLQNALENIQQTIAESQNLKHSPIDMMVCYKEWHGNVYDSHY